VALNIPGRRPAIAEVPVFVPAARGIPPEAWAAIALVFAVTALFSLWAARIAVRPVRMLADAAERFSRNLAEPPLAETGATEIRAASRAFNRMQDRLARHVNNRALAFAAMSHDMRTPLTRMRLRLECLGEGSRELGEDIDEIETLANSALEMTRGLAPDEGLVPVDVCEMLRKLAASYLAMGVRVRLEGQCDAIRARPQALRRVFGNLLDNAIKYARDVEMVVDDSRGELRVRVLDRGPGIPAEDLQKVVHPFYRVETSRNRETGGAGLGLAIAKDIVEGHGGALAIANRAGGGLEVTVRLPR
jgi:signal transduction histidine kinase